MKIFNYLLFNQVNLYLQKYRINNIKIYTRIFNFFYGYSFYLYISNKYLVKY
ncbi:hypothetical protein BCR32DRAFT_122228 [Anaeromyces robustus]|uniref:Uncharacterized protein n=1 Tax=Anaeromyces robustus TaxID=1754192 RepID=A0A1Y1XGS3_9FUNG|nr:hypothetical protein BCR32DRAFT_122228 [Anaeromyces robustus]|eukprot:ORX84584.1 hypothetical protein BCR32DRAFT_122228 [Anaeromyces robustus]